MQTTDTLTAPLAPAAHTDQDIINAVLRGERDRFGDLVDRYERMLYAVAWSRLRNASMAEDIVQETFLRAYRCLPALRNAARLPAWMARIARNLATRATRQAARETDALQRYSREPSTVTTTTAQPGDARQREAQSLTVETALEALPHNNREALVLFYVERRSVRDAATLLGVSESAFKVRLHRARAALKTSVEQSLERDLEQLAPPTPMRAQVMAILPLTTPSLAASPLLGLLKFAPALLQPAMTFGLLGLYQRSLANNFRSGAEIRRRVLWRNFILLVLTVVPFVLVAHWAYDRFGIPAVLGALAVLMAAASVSAIHLWNLARTPFTAATAATNLLAAGFFAAVPLFGLPAPFAMTGFIIGNLFLALAQSNWPQRQDYNLFQRAAMGTLRGPGPGDPPPAPVSAETLDKFVRLVASKMLLTWRTRLPGGAVRLLLPGIALSPARAMFSLLPPLQNLSHLTITPDGRCRAHLCSRNLHSLQNIIRINADPANLVQQVEASVESALACFAAGRPDDALSHLQAETEEQIFHRPPHKLLGSRLLMATALLSGIVFLACVILLNTRAPIHPSAPKPIPTRPTQAQPR